MGLGPKMLYGALAFAGLGELILVLVVLARWSRQEREPHMFVRVVYALIIANVLIIFFSPAAAVLVFGPEVVRIRENLRQLETVHCRDQEVIVIVSNKQRYIKHANPRQYFVKTRKRRAYSSMRSYGLSRCGVKKMSYAST